MKTKRDLIEKAKECWEQEWTENMIEYNPDYNHYIVWIGDGSTYKAFFNADTLECVGTKC